MESVKEYDVIIAGAGPAGTGCALALRDSGLRVAILDKSEFPRDKVCGELMHKKTVETLEKIVPGFRQEFIKFPKTMVLKHTLMHYKGKNVMYDWEGESYTCRRYELDNYLLNLLKETSKTDIYTKVIPEQYTVTDDGVTVTLKDKHLKLKGKLLLGADGVNSVVKKQLAGGRVDKQHYIGAVRTYFSNIKDLKPDTSEIFFNSKYHLNCLWVFPVEGKPGMANVGFGLLSTRMSKRKINLKEAFYDYFKVSPELGEKFKDAKQEGPLEGFGVSLGSTIGTVSGDRFMLIGDAASLTNPISGTGMGNAVVSARLAAEQVKQCFSTGDFSATNMLNYRAQLEKEVYNELTRSFKAQRMLSSIPYVLDIGFGLAKHNWIKKKIQSMV